MADSGLLVTISGPALSLLFYENARSVGDQMGFLLGDVVTFVTKNVTDSERYVESVKNHIEITNILPYSAAGQLFDECGNLHRDKLKAFVHEKSKEIVGWFRFRHNCDNSALTFRDKILHKELAKYFNDCNGHPRKEVFLACVMNASTTDKMGTHKFRHVLLRHTSGRYRPVPLRIYNLGDGMAQKDESNYIPKPTSRLSAEPDVFTKMINSLKLDVSRKNGNELMRTIHKAAESHIRSLIPQVCESDREVHAMEKELIELRKKLIKKMKCRTVLYANDGEQANESNNRFLTINSGDENTREGIKCEIPSRKPNPFSTELFDNDTTFAKTKGSQNSNVKRSPSETNQRSPTSLFSQDKKRVLNSPNNIKGFP